MNNKVAERLNPYVANLAVMFTKLHSLHWNVEGRMFVQVHEYTEGLYDQMAEKMDEVAEKIIMKGQKPASTIKEFVELASVKEREEKTFKDLEVLKEVLADIKLLMAQAIEIRSAFDEEGDFSVVAMLEDHIVGYEKDIWFLESMEK